MNAEQEKAAKFLEDRLLSDFIDEDAPKGLVVLSHTECELVRHIAVRVAAAYAADAVAAEREACCKAVCRLCEECVPMSHEDDLKHLMHNVGTVQEPEYRACPAAAIRAHGTPAPADKDCGLCHGHRRIYAHVQDDTGEPCPCTERPAAPAKQAKSSPIQGGMSGYIRVPPPEPKKPVAPATVYCATCGVVGNHVCPVEAANKEQP